MIKQTCINALLPIPAGNSDKVRNAIDANALEGALAKIDTLHFLAFALLPQDSSASPEQWLLIEANFDGQRDAFLKQFWEHAQVALTPLLNAGGFNVADLGSFMTLLKTSDQGRGINHTALPGMDLGSIRRSAAVYRKAQSAKNQYSTTNTSASSLCAAIAQDQDVRALLLPVPDKWPEDTLKQLHPVFTMVFSFILSFMLIAATGLAPLAQGELSLPKGLLLSVIVFLAPTLVLLGNSPSTSFSVPRIAPSRLLRALIAAVIFGLCLYAFNRFSSWQVPFYVLGFDLLFLFLLYKALNSVPATLGIEYFLLKPIALSFFYPLGILGISLLLPDPISFAAQIWLTAFLLIVLTALFFLPPQPLEPIEKDGLLSGLLVYLLLPFAIPTFMHWFAIGFVIFVFGIVVALICALCRLQQQENFDYESPPIWENDAKRNAIADMEAEHCKRQNHLISVTYVKPGRLRWFAMRIVLLFTAGLRALQGTRGELSGIVTIHFARWILVGEKKSTLLFISNYGGNWGSYLDEFIDHASEGLTSIWSNTRGFPRSKWLRFGGAANADHFKLYARCSQWPTLYHYSAYPEYTVDQIEKYVRLNALLAKPQRSAQENEEVLRLL